MSEVSPRYSSQSGLSLSLLPVIRD
jgi:hypothetical protein